MNQHAKDLILSANSDLFLDGKYEAIGNHFSSDYVIHTAGQDLRCGPRLIRSAIELYRRAFPDLVVDVQFFMDSADTVSWQRTMRATHAGAFKGFPATGQPIVWREMVVSRFCDLLIIEEWIVTDLAEQLLFSRKSLAHRPPQSKLLRSDA
jgi:predicted ester cyclase